MLKWFIRAGIIGFITAGIFYTIAVIGSGIAIKGAIDTVIEHPLIPDEIWEED